MSDLDQELAARGSKASRTSKLTLALVVALVAVAAFGGGVFFQRSTGATTTTTTAAGGPPAAGRQAPGGGGAGGFVSGEVTKVSGSTLTITQPDGSSVQVTTNGETRVTLSSDGALTDLKPGDTVVVQGEQSSDGDLAASSVTEGMLGGGFRNSGGPRPTRTP
ncbi:DUF5666 domain-containing protein [Tenggerimyces flavus]|uniref:DUF5666 domain-containing protein n=1 Tax=Tenggerimyces flavus TaxID=1708749 RepID=A0ABV7YBW6_9ACTN|nr:DUF5666 domain-containing protein [Tenggerimyces flavus]MBM7783553.1 hypothetical protein [Tenggerimyces flavus]